MGKKKKSKAQLEEERRLQEEAEAAAAAEAERLRLEEEKRKAEEEARIKEEQRVARVAEIERLSGEFEQHKDWLADKATQLAHDTQVNAAAAAWTAYRQCDPKVDADDEADLNTYLSLVDETELPQLQDALDRGARTAAISRDLRRIMAAARAAGDAPRVELCAGFLRRLFDSNAAKLDYATARLLHLSDRHYNAEANEILVKGKSDAEAGGEACTVSYGVWVNHEKRGFRLKTLDFTEVGLQVEVPKPVAPHRIAVRSVYVPYDEHSYGNGYVAGEGVDSPYAVLGGTFHVDMFEMPPPKKTIKGFEVRPLTDLKDKVNRLNYPSMTPLAQEETRGPPPTHAPFIRCQLSVPEGVLVGEEPIVGWWNDIERQWETEGVEEAEFNAEKRILRFHTLRVGAHALLKKRAADLPYKSFRLNVMHVEGGDFMEDIDGLPAPKPFKGQSRPECVRITLTLPNATKVVVDVGETACRLVAPYLGLGLVGEEMPGSELVQRLGEAGIHVAPSDADAQNAKSANNPMPGITVKTSVLEETVYEEVASVAASFDVESCTFNTDLGDGKCVFKIRETSIFTGANDMTLDYDLCLVEDDARSLSNANAPGIGLAPGNGAKMTVVPELNKEARRLDMDAFAAGTTYLYLQNALAGGASPEAMERVRSSSVLFQDNLKRFLRLTRPFSFC
uniref:IC97/Casc1 N-terminal domain-containing protein n=1 Tax=Phaeomonas parva TaxID=124430 RepID=A0A7S1XPL8_9STRA|mmetsp:Transcript_23132/g.72069  ORF Transcript_23132/g.72069 Transcript_23132/m.72069 type:complete len:678 (+) Transcript_23132:113-2146(+)